MKKTFVLLLTLVMMFSLCAPALAADTIESVPGTSTGTVSVAYTEGVNDKIVYSVTVDWTDLSMEYQTEGEGTWNPTSHEYEGETVDEWKDNEASVTVTNHSNAGVTATIAAGDSNVLTYSFDKGSFDLATAENTTTENAPSDTFTITATTVPTEKLSETFTVTIAAKEEFVADIDLSVVSTDSTSPTKISVAGSSLTIKTVNGYTVAAKFFADSTCSMAYQNGELIDQPQQGELVWPSDLSQANASGCYVIFTVYDADGYDVGFYYVEFEA